MKKKLLYFTLISIIAMNQSVCSARIRMKYEKKCSHGDTTHNKQIANLNKQIGNLIGTYTSEQARLKECYTTIKADNDIKYAHVIRKIRGYYKGQRKIVNERWGKKIITSTVRSATNRKLNAQASGKLDIEKSNYNRTEAVNKSNYDAILSDIEARFNKFSKEAQNIALDLMKQCQARKLKE